MYSYCCVLLCRVPSCCITTSYDNTGSSSPDIKQHTNSSYKDCNYVLISLSLLGNLTQRNTCDL